MESGDGCGAKTSSRMRVSASLSSAAFPGGVVGMQEGTIPCHHDNTITEGGNPSRAGRSAKSDYFPDGLPDLDDFSLGFRGFFGSSSTRSRRRGSQRDWAVSVGLKELAILSHGATKTPRRFPLA
jgi:hypothetical protein